MKASDHPAQNGRAQTITTFPDDVVAETKRWKTVIEAAKIKIQ
jgi:hypothetical protein